MNSPCRIGMIIARFAPVEGGAETQCRQLSAMLVRKGNSVFVLTQRLPGTSAKEIVDGVPVYRIGIPKGGFTGSLSYMLAGAWWLCRHRRLFDVLHAHIASSPALLAAAIGCVFRIPVVIKSAGSRATGDVALSRATWYGRLKLAFFRKMATMMIAPSNEIRDELEAAGFAQSRIKVIPNGVDTDRFSSAPLADRDLISLRLGLPEGASIVTYAGRLERGKGLEMLISEWLSLPETGHRVLVIIGTGSQEASLKSHSASDTSIIFTGWRDPAPYLSISDIFVLPSSGEGIPNALLEAMSGGCACIATRIGGVTDIITHDVHGLLVPPDNSLELRSALISLLVSPEKRAVLGGNAREHVRSHFSLPMITKRYADLYREASLSLHA